MTPAVPERLRHIEAEAGSPLAQLIEQGYCVIRSAAPAEEIRRLSNALDERFERTPFSVGPFHGHRTKRFHRLLVRSPGSVELVMNDRVMEIVHAILGHWCDFPEVNLTQGVEVHPGAPAQIPHCDQSMWPAPKGLMELSVNIFWPMGEFTAENGATRLWPGTHRAPQTADTVLGEPVVCEMSPGDVLVVLGSTVHAAGANRSDTPRRAAIVSYCLGWLKAYENQSLAYSAEFVRTLPAELQAMLGYRWHRPNLGTYDGQCPSILLADDVPDALATVDSLAPAHEPLVAAYAERAIAELETA
jgi:ectoine hydroxylase-related dioxygenase (phytanoyl-CoA dioxygenase family)